MVSQVRSFPPTTWRLLQLTTPFLISPLAHNRTITNQCLHMPLGFNDKCAILSVYTSSHHTMRPTLIFITNNSFSSSSSMRCPIAFTFILGSLPSFYSWTFLVKASYHRQCIFLLYVPLLSLLGLLSCVHPFHVLLSPDHASNMVFYLFYS